MSISATCRFKKLVRALAVVISLLATAGLVLHGQAFCSEFYGQDQDDIPDIEAGTKTGPLSHGRLWHNILPLTYYGPLMQTMAPVHTRLDHIPYVISDQRQRAFSRHLMGTSPPRQV